MPSCRGVLECAGMKTVMVICLLVLMTRTCCSTAVASQPATADVASDTEPVVDTFKNRPVRDDSLADLLLKNLRFRDVEKRASSPEAAAFIEKLVKIEEEKGALSGVHTSMKRQGMSVAELAAMFSQLKAGRGQASEDGVKLQSLRFGGYE